MIVRRWLCATMAVLFCLSACRHSAPEPDSRSKEQLALFRALNDSMQHLSPNALPLIREQLQQATDSLTWYDYYLMYGRHYLLSGTPDSLPHYTSRVLRFAGRQPQTRRVRGLAATALSAEGAYHYLLRHDADSVISRYMQAYRLMLHSDMQDALPDLSANIGDAYVAKNELPEGSRWYRRALFLVDSLGLPTKDNQTLYLGLGRIYTTVGDFTQARDYYEKTEQYFADMKPNMQSYFLNNYGNYFYFSRQYPEALATFRRLKAHLEHYRAEDNFDMYLCKVNMADVFLNLGQTDSARHYVSEAEDYFTRQGVSAGVYYAHTIRIGIALRHGDYAEVERLLQADRGFDATKEHDLLAIRQQYLNDYYAKVGDYRRAYQNLKESQQDKDSTEYMRKQMRSSDIMMRLTEDTLRLNHQIRMKQQEAAYAKAQLRLWITTALLVLLALAVVLWYSLERRRKLQNHFDMLNLRLQNARQRISPHFVFNVLNSRMNKGDRQERDQLLSLAKLIRTNLDMTSHPTVTLAEELDFVGKYVEVERQLLGEDFTFTMEAPQKETLETVRIPSMLVQILTENAIIHGLKGKEGGKRLCIRVDTDEAATRITVSDNGPGFDIRHYNSERSRTGLNIIRTTVSAINQENKKHKISFDIKNDNGCHCVLTIPKNIKLI